MRLPFSAPRVPVVELRGLIAGRPGALSLAAASEPLKRGFAFARKVKRPLVLAIESPGGSASQSDLIGALIRREAERTGVRTLAVIGDVGASGGYWLACAADEIRASRLSIVGSIGVLTGGFGLDRLIARHEIDRRLFTAGGNKARLDPFRPLRAEDEAFIRALLDDCHTMFKDWVRARRGARLTGPEERVFDGSFMLGAAAKSLGLIDGFGDVDGVVAELGGARARPRWFRPKRPRSLIRMIAQQSVTALADEAELRLAAPRLG